MDYVIRPLIPADEVVLWDMVYQGTRSGEEDVAPAPDIARQPDLARYVEGWGRPGDAGFIVHDAEGVKALGAVWLRSPATAPPREGAHVIPELALAVRPGHRRRGIGTTLLTHWVKANPQQSSIRLMVPVTSPAVRLYERFGFKVVQQSDRDVTMRREV